MIKGCLFLKSLKQLFIISLISCFILLGNFLDASVNGYLVDVGSSSSLYDTGYQMSVSRAGFLKTSYLNTSKNVLMFSQGNYFMWLDSGLPYIHGQSVGQGQGIPANYLWCDSISSIPSNCVNKDYSSNTSDLFQLLTKLDKYFYGKFVQSNEVGEYYQGPLFCFSSSRFGKSACFYACWHPNCGSSTTDLIGGVRAYSNLSNSQNFGNTLDSIPVNKIGIYPDYDPSGTSFTPSTGSRLGGKLITSSGYTNKQMIEGYQCVGLTPELCYGGFPISDIFEPGENYEDFTGYVAGQGATIFDLYSRYSSSFSNINQFLNTVLTRYQNGQINSFKTEPKALLMLGAQMNTAGFKTSYISTYCDLLLYKNNNSVYTGTSIDDLRAQSCYRSQHINDSLKNPDGSDVVGQGSDVGIFGSGEDVDFDPETFFSDMMSKIESGLENVSTGTAVGIIPGYIILFTLALIFIRMISH